MDPSRYSAVETLRNGRRAEIRALKPADRAGLLEAVANMSEEARYRRFFAPKQTIFLLAVAAANSGLAMRIVEPMLPRLAGDFGTSVPATAAVISAFAFAHAGAQYFHGPLGDRFGKLRVVTVLMALSAVAAFGCAAATDLDSLIAWRFATGLFSSASMTLWAMSRTAYRRRPGSRCLLASSPGRSSARRSGRSSAARSLISSAGAQRSSPWVRCSRSSR